MRISMTAAEWSEAIDAASIIEADADAGSPEADLAYRTYMAIESAIPADHGSMDGDAPIIADIPDAEADLIRSMAIDGGWAIGYPTI